MSSPRRRPRKTDKAAPPPPAAKSPVKRAKSPAKKKTEDGPSRKAPRTPPKPSKGSTTTTTTTAAAVPPAVDKNARFVTPSISSVVAEEKKSSKKQVAAKSKVRRSLDMGDERPPEASDDDQKQAADNTRKRDKSPFGNKSTIKVPTNVKRVYEIVNKHTGSIGGNGHGGAIYGELTVGSMQKMTNLMIEYTDLSKESRFIDVGCGLGKPNLHVAQYPGVEFSYGIEMEHVRWMLGMANLDQVLKAAQKDIAFEEAKKDGDDGSKIEHRCFFAHGDITEANFFDPFTHVYMFDIGFPPRLFHQLAEMFNNSQSEYLICYHGPKLMIDRYEFNVELLVQTPTSMHGSAEGHQGYIYRRTKKANKRNSCSTSQFETPCDPLFAKAWEVCREGLDAVSKHTSDEVEKHMGSKSKRVTRSASKRLSSEEKKEE
mmetsp:Transcript_21886/g.32973  ORF Transcript_21886/g.32973 Transcript_21886/m.32973 type:complete len:429 (-) Transcript_21886:86-1372(-)